MIARVIRPTHAPSIAAGAIKPTARLVVGFGSSTRQG